MGSWVVGVASECSDRLFFKIKSLIVAGESKSDNYYYYYYYSITITKPCSLCFVLSTCFEQLPVSGQADLWLFGAALAECEEFAHNLMRFSQDHFCVHLQQPVTPLQGQIRAPEPQDGRRV